MNEKIEPKNYPNQTALEQLDKILLMKADFLVFCWICFTCLILFAVYIVQYETFTMTAGVLGFFLTFYFTFTRIQFHATDYYKLNASRDEDGSHRCIFCGDKEMEKSKSYIMNKMVHTCKHCEEFLYVD